MLFLYEIRKMTKNYFSMQFFKKNNNILMRHALQDYGEKHTQKISQKKKNNF